MESTECVNFRTKLITKKQHDEVQGGIRKDSVADCYKGSMQANAVSTNKQKISVEQVALLRGFHGNSGSGAYFAHVCKINK